MKTGATLLKRANRSWQFQASLCRHRPPAVLQGRRPTVVDDSGSLSITVWACAECGELVEEVRILRQTAELSGGPSGRRPAAARC
jgi:hypothetical protein